MIEKLKPIEKAMEPLFKNLPQLQASVKKSIADVLVWCALVFGGLQLLVAWVLWGEGQNVDNAAQFVNSITRSVGGGDVVDGLGFMFYVSLGVLVASAVTLLAAYPKLKANKKEGWYWLFLGVLLNAVYAVLVLLLDTRQGGGLTDFIFSLLGSLVGFWLLFQVKDTYNKPHTTHKVN